ncbi:ead/Ea22-like family protein [Salmonella enterica subsp. enterica serovar Berlin]|nr:ead/Ea22-like family protein [Salmonella enterica subsp. enterica serovar Berlin]
MTALNKQALLRAAVKIGAEKWTHDGNGEVTTEEYVADGQALVDHICNCEVVGTSSLRAEFIALANPAAILALLDELEVAEKRIAELEAREVTLPAEKFCPSEYAGSQYWEETEVWNKAISGCAAAIRAAGIGVKGE